MIWKRGVAVCWLLLALFFLLRVFWAAPTDKLTKPVLLERQGPFYPVYFSSLSAERLVPEFREGEGSVAQRLADLIEGPRRADLSRVLPPNVEVLGFEQRGSLILVNFSRHLISNHPGGSRGEIMSVYGIVNTLVGVSGIEQVQILVEGQRVNTLVGHLYIGEPLHKDCTLLGCSLI